MIEPEIMAGYGREQFGVAIPSGKGYIGTLNVYHELHCIKRLYQDTYPEAYGKGLTSQQKEANRLHKGNHAPESYHELTLPLVIDHCLDFLRQASMCHADVGIITFQWSADSLVPVANSTTHQCANWKKLDAWTKRRTVDMMKPGWLIHPTKGPKTEQFPKSNVRIAR
ncbi:Uncharacterized protein TPAR_07846 [Tolypocladium paradoxum]|uniref:Uncharacterized protein n=1 Tax=Tolypocladium paradoxum TaxID=94208 RepID=A0A2S4KP29_9HYPO|nr:Uncharacterized protein TPAR_07846 [Tolypocladium paradoxum]